MIDRDGFGLSEIVVSQDRCEMRLVWSDGRDAAMTASALRIACRCAWCTRDRLLDRFHVEAELVKFAHVNMLGSHGLHIKFSDGHERGIYPWAYLEELTQAPTSLLTPDTTAPAT